MLACSAALMQILSMLESGTLEVSKQDPAVMQLTLLTNSSACMPLADLTESPSSSLHVRTRYDI